MKTAALLHDRQTFWRSDRAEPEDAAIYICFEAIPKELAQTDFVYESGVRLRKFITRYLIEQSDGSLTTPYTQCLSEIWAEILPDESQRPTHFLEIGHKFGGRDRVPFVRLPLRLINPDRTALTNISEIFDCLKFTATGFQSPPSLPLLPTIKHRYTISLCETLFLAWVRDRGLADRLVAASAKRLFDLSSDH